MPLTKNLFQTIMCLSRKLSARKTYGLLLGVTLLRFVGCTGDRTPVEMLETTPRTLVVRPIDDAKVEGHYKFTGVRSGARTQLAWKLQVLVENAPPQPKPFEVTGGTVTYDFLCLGLRYKLLSADGFTLSRGFFWIPSLVGENSLFEIEEWVLYDAAIRTAKAEGRLTDMEWRYGGCPSPQ